MHGPALKSYLEMLDPIHNEGLRLCLGTFRTSPAPSLYVEANEAPLSLRRQKLTLQYALKLHSNPSNPAHDTVFHPNYSQLFSIQPNTIPTFGIRLQTYLETSDLDLDQIAQFKIPNDPPWQMKAPTVLFDLQQLELSSI